MSLAFCWILMDPLPQIVVDDRRKSRIPQRALLNAITGRSETGDGTLTEEARQAREPSFRRQHQ